MANLDVEPVDAVDDSEEAGGDDAASTDVEVEATDDLSELPGEVDAAEFVLYGGKGGVGKTTMAAATALRSAADGATTLVVSTDPAHSLSDTLGGEIPAEPTRIREDIPLFAAEIDPDAAMDEGLFGEGGDAFGGMGGMGDMFGGMGGMGGMGGAGGSENPFGGDENPFTADEGENGHPLLDGTMPGADEMAAMRQLLEHMDDPRFDRVVVDTAPTGHTLRLLQLPEMLDSMVGRLVSFRERMRGMMENLKGMFGGADPGPSGMEQLEEAKERIKRLRAVLRDPERTDFRVVMIPEEMSVVESERLVARLDEFGIPVRTLVVNRVMEDPSDVAGIDPEWTVAPDPEHCEFCQRRWQVQQRSLRRATELFRGRDVKRVPLLADEVRGEDALRVVAACLA
ncbi:TRC40/GET3/ArsA family transport-energizing ATPase [Haloprofundus sp. MHR1]|uniref:ArsA family ATPase n=1 Tax=Haloprofundus sp. MHR1 TaxID=2572921 RepID=UPI0010BEDEBC|nr:TRC40/GET3/ArsA family transport-energizing ATPase [Haloprofundus sp. MHR1]QCJ47590.1 arsenic-transporting ATPase [Haloprofundus sp. MHR1]